MKKRFLSVFLVFAMILTLIPTMSFAASAEVVAVPYIYYTVDGNTAMRHDDGVCDKYDMVTEDTTTFENGKWYIVEGNVTINELITIQKTANLILCDGSCLNAKKGIRVYDLYDSDSGNFIYNNVLNIYGQEDGTGKLIADAGNTFDAAIGGGKTVDYDIKDYCGTVNIHGGDITAIGGFFGGSGIGASIPNGEGEACQGGNITIFDGKIYAVGRDSGSGIGSSMECGNGSLTVYGGDIVAKAEDDGPGISANKITINGGNIEAIGGRYAQSHGITSGRKADKAVLTINGGTVTARNGWGTGAGITFDDFPNRGEMYMNGGTLNAFGSFEAIHVNTTINRDKIRYVYSGESPEKVTREDAYSINHIQRKPFFTTNTPVEYVARSWNESTQKVEEFSKKYAFHTTVNEHTTLFEDGRFYVVSSDVTISKRITVEGNANLILSDGVTLTVDNCIQLEVGNTLNIYGQSKGTGKLVVNGGAYGTAGIGSGSSGTDSGTLNIHGGEITANGACYGAGIGGGNLGNGGNVTIYGGKVVAAGNGDAAGIGGGIAGYEGEIKGNGGIVTIYDGEVTAITNGGAGIGGGNSSMRGRGGKGATVSIYGGKVIAAGGIDAVAIGGGKNSTDNGSLSISKGMLIMGGPNEDNLTEISNVTNEKYVVISKSSEGHSWQDATCTTPKTCSVCGATEGKALDHTWIDATCTNPKTCSVCGITEGEALGHTWIDATCTEPKTCSVCGTTEGKTLDHTWIDATCTEPKTCSVCHMTEGKALGHYYVATTMISEATCTQCALYIMECTRCDAKLDSQPVGKPKSHTWLDETCTEPKKCSVCGTKATLSYPLGHEYRPIKKVSDEPLTYSAKCIRCDELTDNYLITDESFDYTDTTTYKSVGKGETLKAGTKLQATSGFGDGELTVYIDGKLAAVVNGGETWAAPYCIKCVDYDTKIIPVRLTMWFETACNYTFANCEDPETCVYCGHTVGSALGHDFEDGICMNCGIGIFEFDAKSLALDSALVFKFKGYLYDPNPAADAYMEFKIGDIRSVNVPLSDAVKDEKGRYVFTCYLNVLEVNEKIEATFHDGEMTFERKNPLSVTDYLDAVLANHTGGTVEDAKVVNLVYAVSNYAHYAQIALDETHTEYEVGNGGKYVGTAARTNITLYTADELEKFAAVKEVADGFTDVKSTSRSLVLDDETAIVVYITPANAEYIPNVKVTDKNGNDVNFTCDKQDNGKYKVVIRGIAAHKLADNYTVDIDDGKLKYTNLSALSYAYSVLDSSKSDAYKNAVSALYDYYNATIDYKG